MIGTIDILRKTITEWDRGRIFFIDDFAAVESQWSVRFGLSQMAKEGIILRLARGIYCYPRIAGEHAPKFIVPNEETIAYAVAAKEHARIIPYGDQAAYRLGLTGIRLSDMKFLTDGAPRRICLSNGKKIFFNHTSEVKIFDFCNEYMQMVSSAIRVLGTEMIGEEERRIVRDTLRKVPEREFMKDIHIPPAWVQEIMLECWNR